MTLKNVLPPVHKTVLIDTSGNPYDASGSGSSNATAANQTLQITQETAINTVLGTVTASPTANTIADRLKALLTGIILAAGSAIIGKVGIDQTTPGTTNLTYVKGVSVCSYETVAANATAQVLGGAGATGDFLVGLLVIPSATTIGAISILDNATSITVYAGTAAYDAALVPFFIPIGANSVSGAWKVTTGAGASVVGVGNFT